MPVRKARERRGAYFCQMLLHNLGSVVHSKYDVCDASSCQSFNLVQNHGLVSELDQGLGESKGLCFRQSLKYF